MSTVRRGTVGTVFRTLACLGLTIVVARATSVPRLPLEQLVGESDTIVTGVVTRTWAEWDAAHKLIWTRSQIAVQQMYKGRAAKVVVVNEPGGEAEGTGMTVAGSVRYTAGDRVLLFLKDYAGVGFRTHGWGQGKYIVDPSGILHADDSLQSLELTSLPSIRQKQITQKIDGLSLAQAQQRIASQVRSGAAK